MYQTDTNSSPTRPVCFVVLASIFPGKPVLETGYLELHVRSRTLGQGAGLSCPGCVSDSCRSCLMWNQTIKTNTGNPCNYFQHNRGVAGKSASQPPLILNHYKIFFFVTIMYQRTVVKRSKIAQVHLVLTRVRFPSVLWFIWSGTQVVKGKFAKLLGRLRRRTGSNPVHSAIYGHSQEVKAWDFDSQIRWFKSSCPCHLWKYSNWLRG